MPEDFDFIRDQSRDLSSALKRLAAAEQERDELQRRLTETAEDGWGWKPRAEAAERERDALRAKLADAAQEIAEWGAYASEDLQKKYHLAETVQEYRQAALAQQPGQGEGEAE